MKRCPECRRDYYDDSLLYCLDDGTALLEGPASGNEPATAILHDTSAPSEAATKAQIHTTNMPGFVPEAATARKAFPIKLVVLIAVVLLLIGGGFFGFRYFTANAKQINSIAVMPFVNASGNADIEYLSDGVTESLINNLSQLSNLSVKARSSVFRYKGKDVEPQQVASELKVQAVLNGRVTQRGDSLTISLDLVDGSTGDQIWGEQYTRKAGDLAALQSEIARDVSQKLRARLSGADQQRVVKNQTQNTEAYQLYLQGRYNWNKRTDATTKKAIEFFKQATEKDPNYAMAYVGLAESYILTDAPIEEKAPDIVAATTRALDIDPTLGEPHTVLVALHDNYERDYALAEQEHRRAIELSPNYPTAYHWYAEFLMEQRRPDESLANWKKALELDPFSLAIGTDYALEYLANTRQYDQAIDYLNKLVGQDPNYVRTHSYLAVIYETVGRYEDAVNEREKAAVLRGEDPTKIAGGKKQILDALHSGGAKGFWSKALEFTLQGNKDKPPALDLAVIYTRLGNKDDAFKWLDKAVDEKTDGDVQFVQVSPVWDPLRDDPRYTAILRKLRFIE